MRERTGCQLPHWEMFLKDLHHDLQTYKENHIKLEKLMKQKDVQHQNYVSVTSLQFYEYHKTNQLIPSHGILHYVIFLKVKKMFEEIENQLREEKEKEHYTEQVRN